MGSHRLLSKGDDDIKLCMGVAVLKSSKRLRVKLTIMEAGEDIGKLIKQFYLIQEERIKVYSTFSR